MTNNQEIKHGFLYIVINDFTAESREIGRRVVVEKGEIVEFRYFSPVHFRTKEDLYLKCEEEHFLKNTEAYGEIWDNVRSRGKHTLAEIIDCKLYEKIKGE